MANRMAKNNGGEGVVRRHRPLKTVFRALLILMMILIIAGCIVASIMTVYVINTLDSGDSIVLDEAKLGFSTIIYATNEKTGEYEEIQRVQTNENRIWVDYDDIPQSVKDAAVAVEDKRYWTHPGVDFKRTIMAAINMFNPFSDSQYGGSTITQQVVKNITGEDAPRVDRKLREIFRAINLQKNYSKEQILEVYLNTIALGNAQNGVGSASQLYFGKDVSEVTPAEAASLIAITQNPSVWDPFRYPDNNKKRREDILWFMSEQTHPDGTPMLTKEEYEEALKQDLHFKADEYHKSQEKVQNWFIDTVYEEVLNDLVEKAGYTKAGAWDALKSQGFRIY
ncbi:MAG: biosynthetic peptidoglycan transglycosylase, partial [Oscillospiraceae bacterium]